MNWMNTSSRLVSPRSTVMPSRLADVRERRLERCRVRADHMQRRAERRDLVDAGPAFERCGDLVEPRPVDDEGRQRRRSLTTSSTVPLASILP